MSQLSQIKVFKECYDLLIILFRSTPNVKRDYRHTILEVVKRDLVELCIIIYRANKTDDQKTKSKHIAQAQELLVRITIQCRILADLSQISSKLLAQISLHFRSIEKQLDAWLKYVAARIDTTKINPNGADIEALIDMLENLQKEQSRI